jgi:hypothetical protein
MNNLDFRVHEDPSPEWFLVGVSQYDDNSPSAIVHVMGSPGQVLAKFVQQLSELSGGSDPAKIKFLDQEEVIDPCTIALAKSVSNLQCRVETADGHAHEAAIGYESQSLGEVLQHESVVPSRVPAPGFVHDQCMAYDLPFSDDEFEQACQALKSTIHDRHLLLALNAGETLLQTLGEGQSSSPVVSPRQLYDTLLSESREKHEGSKRQVAMAFLEYSAAHNNVDTSAATYDADQFIDEALADLEELIEKVERRLPNWQQWQSDNRKMDEDSLVYYRYVKGAIADNREFLVRLNSN